MKEEKKLKHEEKLLRLNQFKILDQYWEKFSFFKHMIKLNVQYRPTTLIEKKRDLGRVGRKSVQVGISGYDAQQKSIQQNLNGGTFLWQTFKLTHTPD